MKLISREIAEDLIGNSKPVHSQIDQNANALKITFTLANGTSLLVNYDQRICEKSYYIITKE